MIKAGVDVKKSELHGMAQRGGAVVAHMRYGDKVYAPVIEPGSADIQVAFEMMESLRYLSLLKKDCKVIVNTQKILPLSVSTGGEEYPSDIPGKLSERGLSVYTIDAIAVAGAVGEVRTVNMVMVGALSCFVPVE
ncbi:MAG TPA: indolepyruvate oxidoreductase subunit beta, partial [Nitrospirae bacterium]|nr:indolepyruvate oxidoreductase subunit beta [Nitrospirota bacterium]